MSEASLEVLTRYRNDLEEEKQQLQKELEKFRIKVSNVGLQLNNKNKKKVFLLYIYVICPFLCLQLQDLEDQFVQSERRNHQLKNALDDKEREMITAFQKVQEFSTGAAGAEKAVKQLEEHVQK